MEIYIVCPAKYATGGTELLHQFHFKLRERGVNSFLYYFDFDNTLSIENNIAERFKKYVDNTNEIVCHVEDIVIKDRFIVIPESYITNFNFNKIKVIYWWLSVDYFFINNNLSKDKFIKQSLVEKLIRKVLNKFPYSFFDKKNVILNLYQCEYIRLFLKSMLISKILPLSDYINKTLTTVPENNQKENLILFNPKKGFDVIKPIIEASKNKYNWLALENMTPSELQNVFSRAKIYIDFGFHPGKDRIPREAAINGCCVITNLDGAAHNLIDIQIQKKYKFEAPIKEKHKLYSLIDNIFNDFESHYANFSNYRKQILGEEEVFDKEIEFLIKYLRQQ